MLSASTMIAGKKLQNDNLSDRLSQGWSNLRKVLTSDQKFGRTVSSLLLIAKAGGFNPKFDDLNEAEAKQMLTTGIEVLRMIRNNNPNSEDKRARDIYSTLITAN